jgi:hypothetical protein
VIRAIQEAVAYHEAGHGMSALILGAVIKRMTIANSWLSSSGRATYVAPDSWPPQYHVVVAMGGEAGAEIFGFDAPASPEDLAMADYFLARCRWSRERAKAEARRLLSHSANKRAVWALAEELLRCGVVEGPRLVRIAYSAAARVA